MTVAALIRYRSENKPEATTQKDANTYGGALRPCAAAAVNPMLRTIVGSDKAKPYSAMVLQIAIRQRIQVWTDLKKKKKISLRFSAV